MSRQSPHWLRPGAPCGSCRALRRCRSACSRPRWGKARAPAGDLALFSLPATAAGDALRRDGVPGGNIRSGGLPLLQPLPLRWSGRPRGLRVDNIVHIVTTVDVTIVNTVNIVSTVDIAQTYIFSHPIGWSRLPGKFGCMFFSHPCGWSRLPGKRGFNITVNAFITIVGPLSGGLHTGPP